MSSPVLRLSNISFIKGQTSILNNINLELSKGEFLSIFGGSGCGKSTLLMIAAGIEKPTSGRIYLDGIDVTDLPAEKRHLNLIFQSYALFPHMTVEENIAFGLNQEALPRDVVQARIKDILKRVKLEGYEKRSVNNLSGGEKQRVAIARAVVKRPSVLLLDEPFSALDRSLRSSTQFEIMELQETLEMTFLMVTHDQEEAMTVSSRIGVLQEGNITQIEQPRRLYEFPNSLKVAEFVGEINKIHGVVQKESQGLATLLCEEIGEELQVQSDQGLQKEDEAYILVRPEKVLISPHPLKLASPGRLAQNIAGRVTDIAYSGNTSTYHVTLESGKIIKSNVAENQRIVESEITWDQQVYVGWDIKNSFLLKK